MESRVLFLEDLVESLQGEVEQLRADVNRLQRRLARLDIGDGASSQASVGSVLDSPAPSGGAARSSGYSLVSSTPLQRLTEAVGSPPVLTWEERLEICDQIGVWVKRTLLGHHRGSSGRDRIPLASRLWLVAQDYHGNRVEPIRVFRRFSDCRELVKRGSDCGWSVFIGLPSEREARRVCEVAGLEWPN